MLVCNFWIWCRQSPPALSFLDFFRVPIIYLNSEGLMFHVGSEVVD